MAVVISEFEVLPEPQTETRKAEPDGGKASPPEANDPCAIRTVLRALENRTLRTWAH